MARRRAARDITMEEYDRWSAATKDIKEVMEATAEEGGPRVSFVPQPKSVPLDFLPDVVQLPVPAPAPGVVPFKPEPSRKVGGWNAARQRHTSKLWRRPGRSIWRPGPRACRRAPLMRFASARPLSPPPGTPRSSSPSAACPRSPSTAPSTAASSRSIIRAIWSAKSACRASASSCGSSAASTPSASLCPGNATRTPPPTRKRDAQAEFPEAARKSDGRRRRLSARTPRHREHS